MTNMFAEEDDVVAVIYQAVGAGSTCWENMSDTGVFQDEKARQVAQDAAERVNQLYSERDEEYNPDKVMQDLETQLRVTAATIGTNLPWAASEVPNKQGILERFEYVYEFIKKGVNNDLTS